LRVHYLPPWPHTGKSEIGQCVVYFKSDLIVSLLECAFSVDVTYAFVTTTTTIFHSLHNVYTYIYIYIYIFSNLVLPP
jgi:hypothetical protein